MSFDVFAFISFILTLLIFSYIFGDNLLFRFATYAFVGVTAGYLVVVVIYQVLLPRLVTPLLGGDLLFLAPLGLGILLILKAFPRYTRLGSIPLAYLVGVAAAVAIGGAVYGTLTGQVQGAMADFNFNTPAAEEIGPTSLVFAIVMLVGTIGTLVYFQFGGQVRAGQPGISRPPLVEGLAWVGQFFIAITLGALFAGVYSASLTALIERLDSILAFIRSLIR